MYYIQRNKEIVKSTETKQEAQQIIEEKVKSCLETKQADVWKLSDGYRLNGVAREFYEVIPKQGVTRS